jgi:general secretion pathway protein D
VEDGQILVLGGLIDDQLSESAQKVPLLGDVPLLGNLFRYRNTNKLRRNLMVFLHPVILREPAQATFYTSDKYSYIRGQQLAARDKGYLLPDTQPPMLKPEEEVKAQGSILDLQSTPPPPVPPPSAAAPVPAPRAPRPVGESAEFGFNNR